MNHHDNLSSAAVGAQSPFLRAMVKSAKIN